MIRLLLIFVLSPVIAFGQTLRQGVVDSIKAETVNHLQPIPSLLGNNAGNRVQHVDVFDTGEYVTIVVRVYVPKIDTIAAIAPLAPVNMKAVDTLPVSMGTVPVPPLPPPVAEAVNIEALALAPPLSMDMGDIVAVSLDTLMVPPLPRPVAEAIIIDALALQPPVNIKTAEIVAVTLDTLPLPPLPRPVAEAIIMSALAPQPLVNIKTGGITAVSVSMVAAPPLPRVVAEPIIDLVLHPAINIKTENIASVSLDTVTTPPLPRPVLDSIIVLPPEPLAYMKTGGVLAVSLDTVTLPPLPPQEKEMPVAEMHLSADGYSLLEKLEGFSPELYSLNDGGYTIGFGFFVPYAEVNKWEKGVTLEQAEQMMRQKVPAYEDQVKKYINVPVTQNEFDALTMLAYNLGGFSKATSIVNDINGQVEFEKLQSDWNRFVHSKAPGVAKGLLNRRKDELGVKIYSEYQPERKIQILKIRK